MQLPSWEGDAPVKYTGRSFHYSKYYFTFFVVCACFPTSSISPVTHSHPQYQQSLLHSQCPRSHPFTMHSSPVSTRKRPEYKTSKSSKSAAWSWPHLVPIHEQQSRPSQGGQSSAFPPLLDRSEQEEPPNAMTSKLHTEGDTPPSSALSSAGSSPTAGESVAGTVKHQPHELPRNSLSLSSDPDDDDRPVAGSDSCAVEDLAKQGETEIAVGSEDTGMHLPLSCGARSECADHPVVRTVIDVPLKEESPATPSTTPIPPVVDRISPPSSSVPYYATPKIMVHKPSQSSVSENSASRTIDELLANNRQSLPQATALQAPGSTQDGNLTDVAPMQSMSLTPIAWQAPETKVLKRRKLYLRKIRNVAARKTILQLTLGRQLAIPTKEMLRLLANGENLTVPDLSNPSVEAATMLVPQEAVGPVTGAVLLPQGVTGAVSDH